MKKRLVSLTVLLLSVALIFLHPRSFPGWVKPALLPASQSRMIQKELFRAEEVCRGAVSADDREARLIEAGFAVEDSDPVYPSYLANSEQLQNFVQTEAGHTTVFHVNTDGSLWHQFFVKGCEDFLVLTQISTDFSVSGQDILPLYEMELAEWEVFYYRCYPADDPHYIDYSSFRLTPVNRELYDLTMRYIHPVGYRMVNLFLCDWQEGSWGALSINDTFEYLYELQSGTAFPWQEYPIDTQTGYAQIPAALFEDTVLPFFSISREELRDKARYDSKTDSYPWRAVHGNDLTAWELPLCQPEVTECRENPDGTLTLTVQVGCPDRKTNALFAHEVTVRPLNDGIFQYTGNQITVADEQGLLPAFPRFQLDLY